MRHRQKCVVRRAVLSQVGPVGVTGAEPAWVTGTEPACVTGTEPAGVTGAKPASWGVVCV